MRGVGMISASNLAQMALSYSQMSNKKLQKICYYIYSWHLAIFQVPIADVEFEAWVHGPVSPTIYNLYKRYGWNEIPKYIGFLPIEEDVLRFANCVCDYYSQFTADELETMTHLELPWKNARKGTKSYESSKNVISNEDIMVCYSNKSELKEKIFGGKII